MNTIHLYKFKDHISRKMLFLTMESNPEILDDHIQTNFPDIEIVTEYIINIPNTLSYKDLPYKELLRLCSSAKQTIEHYFIKNNNGYDMI